MVSPRGWLVVLSQLASWSSFVTVAGQNPGQANYRWSCTRQDGVVWDVNPPNYDEYDWPMYLPAELEAVHPAGVCNGDRLGVRWRYMAHMFFWVTVDKQAVWWPCPKTAVLYWRVRSVDPWQFTTNCTLTNVTYPIEN